MAFRSISGLTKRHKSNDVLERVPSGHLLSDHRTRTPLPWIASPVDPEAQKWLERRKRLGTGVQRGATVKQFEEESNSDSAQANRIFRKQHEASSLELFFDLFFVANLAVFTTKSAHVDLLSFQNYIGFFVILWTTWFHFSMYDVRFYVDSVFTRVVKLAAFGVFTSFTALGPMYMAIYEGTTSKSFQGVALLLCASRIILVIQYMVVLFFVRGFDKTVVPLVLTMLTHFIAAFGFLGTYLEDVGKPVLDGVHGYNHVRVWYVVIALEVVASMAISVVWRILSYKHTHVIERIGLLTLIIMGEGIIGLTKSTSYVAMGTDVIILQQLVTTAAAVLFIYVTYVLYFDAIEHHRFGTIGQQIWTLLHFPLHLAILLSVEGSTAMIIWNACRSGIVWIDERLPTVEDPAKGFTSTEELITSLNTTFVQASKRFKYKSLASYYNISADIDKLRKIDKASGDFGKPAWTNAVREVLEKTHDYYEYFLFQNFGAEASPNLENEKDYGKKVELFESGFEFVYKYYYTAAGATLLFMALLYGFGRQTKTKTEWTSIGVRLVGAIGLPMMLISKFDGDKESRIMKDYPWLLIPIALSAYLLVIVVDNIIKWGSQKAKSSISRHSRMPLGDPEDNPSDYEMHKRMHGSPQMIHPDDADNIALMTHAQKQPKVGQVSVGYASIEQHDRDEVSEEFDLGNAPKNTTYM